MTDRYAQDPFAGLGTATDEDRGQVRTAPKPTPKQMAFVETLLNRLHRLTTEAFGEETADAQRDGFREDVARADRRTISQLIDVFQSECERMRQNVKAKGGSASAQDVPEGIHFLDDNYYKVQVAVHGSGRKYAKVWSERGMAWSFAKGAVNRLSEATKVSAEDAAWFGQLYGVCCFCSRTLTDERSIDVGYGPVCAANASLPWG